MNETKIENNEGRVSYHDSVEEMLKRIRIKIILTNGNVVTLFKNNPTTFPKLPVI